MAWNDPEIGIAWPHLIGTYQEVALLKGIEWMMVHH